MLCLWVLSIHSQGPTGGLDSRPKSSSRKTQRDSRHRPQWTSRYVTLIWFSIIYCFLSLSLRGVPSLHVTPASPTSSRFLRGSLTRQSHVCFPRDVRHNPETWRRGRQCKRGSFGIRSAYRGSPGERMTMDMTRELCAWPWIRHTGASFFQGLETKKRFLGTPESLVCKEH